MTWMNQNNNGGGCKDGLVVRTRDIRPYVEKFIKDYNAEHPTSAMEKTRSTNGYPPGFGAQHYLICKMENDMNLTEREYKNSKYTGVLRRIRDGQTKFIGYGLVDILCSAMDRPDLMQVIKPMKNPRWGKPKFEKWLADQMEEVLPGARVV